MQQLCDWGLLAAFAMIATCGCGDRLHQERAEEAQTGKSPRITDGKMSKHIAFHTCNLGDAVRKGTNPFTGEPVEFPIDDGLSDSERMAVKQLLSEFHAIGPDPDGYYQIVFSNDTSINVGAGALDGATPCIGIAMEIEGPASQDVVRFARRLALEGNMAVSSAIDPDIVALVARSDDPRICERWPDAPILTNDDDFIKWVAEQLEIAVSE